jgi:hypothetical protein
MRSTLGAASAGTRSDLSYAAATLSADPAKPGRRWLLAGAALLLLGAAVRVAFAHAQGLPDADPWRHLLLLRNLREGRGFTLFDGQPYVWYSPVWYRLAAWLAPPEAALWVAVACSCIAVPLFALYVGRLAGRDATAAAAAGVLFAGFGPLVAAASQLGAEAFALLLLVAALALCATGGGALRALAGGGLFGLAVASRMQLALDALLFLPLVRRPRAALAFAGGAALPLAAHAWRNHAVIRAHPFLFTWDGLATAREDYGLLSTVAVQLHPSVAAATRLLYRHTHALPEWLWADGRLRWELLAALVAMLAAVAASRRLELALAALASLVYFVALDATLSARFFRIWLGVFPVLLAGTALAAARLARRGAAGRAAAAALVLAALAAGAPDLRPREAERLENATPPPELLAGSHYLVQSGYFHPESLLYRYPERHFVGMPLEPERFAAFAALYPEYRGIVWHGWNVQRDLLEALRASGRWHVARRGTSASGYAYRIWELRGPEAPGSGAR